MNTIAGRNVLYVKHSIDDRFSETDIVTHDGRCQYATVRTSDLSNILKIIEKYKADVVCIDEGQFFASDIIDAVRSLIDQNIDTYISGLDMDIHAGIFPNMAILMAMADHVTKRVAICTNLIDEQVCGSYANHTAKMTPSDETLGPHIEVGGLETYQPRCRTCFQEHVKNMNISQV